MKSNKLKESNKLSWPAEEVSPLKLGGIQYLFSKDAQLKYLHPCNLIFGKNATGKSSISKYIRDNEPQSVNVRLFSKKESKKLIKGDDYLDAFSLGKAGVKNYKKILNIKENLQWLHGQLSNIKEDLKQKEKHYRPLSNSVNKWYSKCGSKIKNNYFYLVNDVHYDKNSFKLSLTSSRKAPVRSEDDINKYKKELKENNKQKLSLIKLPQINLHQLITNVNSLLCKTITSNNLKAIAGINNREDEKFASKGLLLYNKNHNSVCAFCGNKISPLRIQHLNMFFDQRYLVFRSKILNTINVIKQYQSNLKDVNTLTPRKFYLELQNNVNSVNDEIRNYCRIYNSIFDTLIHLLTIKMNNTNLQVHNYRLSDNDKSIFSCEHDINKLINKNNHYQSSKLYKNNIYKNRILNNLIQKMSKEFDYDSKHQKLNVRDKNEKQDKIKISKIRNKIDNKQNVRKQLLKNSRKQNYVLDHINDALSFLGDASFKVCYKNGMYYIKSWNKNSNKYEPNNISSLSTGEWNLISFLYFYYSILPDNPDNDISKKQVIIFDDPMDSNDVDFQYLMIVLLRRLIRKINNRDGDFGNYYLLIFTHNVHFYLNIKYNFGQDKLYLIHLIKMTHTVGIQYIGNSVKDFKNDYQELWAETVFLYNQDQPEFMLNPIRRIIETFINFNALDSTKFFGKKHQHARKLFNVLSHGIDDINTSSEDINKNDVKRIFKDLFVDNGYGNHFRNCWSHFSNYGKEI